ncbi:MAG TPA: iron ABC transporter permease [Firmicutes bacterium]|nr:iron ABC transporter permease [Bacillota bacterium]
MTKRLWFFLTLLLLVPVVAVAGVSVGQVTLSPLEAARLLWESLTCRGPALSLADPPKVAPAVLIVRDLRLPRLLLGLMVGGALAVSGSVLQALFRNPLADPYVLGVSAGAALGATAGLVFQVPLAVRTGLPPVPTLAFLGAAGATALVYLLARGASPRGSGGSRISRFGQRGPTRLLLAGIAVSALLSAGVSLLLFFGTRNPGTVVVWLMGGLAGRGWESVQLAWPYLALGLLLVGWCARDLNLLAMGEETAYHLGAEPARLETLVVFGVTLLTAAAVAVSGLIGFVGLIVPHLVRYFTGPDHRFVLPGAFLLGGTFLAAADILARVVLAPAELPVGIVTALCGGPFFLYLLYRSGEAGTDV